MAHYRAGTETLIRSLRDLRVSREGRPVLGEPPRGVPENVIRSTLLERAHGARRLVREKLGSRRRSRFLDQFRLDPDTLPRPLTPPGEGDFIICGCPRTGTTLLCAALFQPPAVITVSEPWEGMNLPPDALFAHIRAEIGAAGRLQQGRLDLKTLVETGKVRWCEEGKTARPVELIEDYLLGVKWPAFWRYVELLPQTKFLLCVRDPFEVVNSFKNASGRLSKGLDHEIPFNARMNQDLRSRTADVALRWVLLSDYINQRMLPYLNRSSVFTVRYERWFTDREALMQELSSFLGAKLTPGPAILHPPKRLTLTDRELALVRAHCTTAEPLGYSLDQYR